LLLNDFFHSKNIRLNVNLLISAIAIPSEAGDWIVFKDYGLVNA
jgi:hypothetical protein